jgi:hypothetical protein
LLILAYVDHSGKSSSVAIIGGLWDNLLFFSSFMMIMRTSSSHQNVTYSGYGIGEILLISELTLTHSLTHSPLWCKIVLKSINNYHRNFQHRYWSLWRSNSFGYHTCLLSHSSLCVNNPQRCTRYHPLLYKEPQERRT